jgi:hypothetical protein
LRLYQKSAPNFCYESCFNMKNSLACSGAVTWNSLSDDIKSTEDVTAFKMKVSNDIRDS